MAQSNTLSQLDAAAKQIYKDANYSEDLLKDRVLYGMLPKDTSYGGASSTGQSATVAGRGMPIVLKTYRSGAGGKTFADTQNADPYKEMKLEGFQFRHVNDYGVFQVPGESLDIMRSAEFSFVSVLQECMDDIAEVMADRLEIFSYRTGAGGKAKVSSLSGEVVTLTNRLDAQNFELGELVEHSNGVQSTVTANKPVDSAAAETRVTEADHEITAIDIDAGKLTLVDASDVTGGNDGFLGSYGDLQSNGALSVKISGLAAWCPTDETTGSTASELAVAIGSSTDLFFGVNRSTSYKLRGVYTDQSAVSRETALIKAQAILGERGGAPKNAIIPHDQYRALLEELGAKREYCDVNAMGERGLVANISYGGVFVHGISGAMKVTPAIHAPTARAWLLNPDDHVLYSAGPAISLQDRDGLSILRKSTSDDYEGRFVFRGNLICRRPGRQAQVKLKAV